MSRNKNVTAGKQKSECWNESTLENFRVHINSHDGLQFEDGNFLMNKHIRRSEAIEIYENNNRKLSLSRQCQSIIASIDVTVLDE